MIYLLVNHQVRDFAHWREVFDSALWMRRSSGEENYRLFRDLDNPNKVTLLMEWDNLDKARRYLASPELKKAMAEAGVVEPVDVQLLGEAIMVRRTAAD